MEYRALGSSSLRVSALCLGCMNFGGRAPEDESIRIIHAAIDSGINFLDTANVYGKGISEEVVGKALAIGGHRDNVVLATKVSNRWGDGPNESGSSRYHIMQQCEGSLRRLKTDHIDLYQLHLMDLDTPPEESMRAMDDLVKQGKVLYVGTSKWAPAWLVEAQLLCERHGWSRIVCEQPPYNLLDRTIENELLWTCRRHGIGIIPWAPIGTGILSGRYEKDLSAPSGSRFDSRNFRDRLNARAVEIAEGIKPLAKEKGITPAELALAWVLRRPCVTAPIIGVRTMEHLTSALSTLDVVFSDEDLARIDEIAPPGTAVSDYYDTNVHRQLRAAVGVDEMNDE